ncbi:MAG: DUF5050 domain-containing protein [Acidobacteria bacterium]|nr:DUF5050 domain-containing protein [Acidobacteriota bacterium]
MQTPPRRTVRFAAFEVDLATAELRKHGTPVRLQEQPFQILCALLERPGELVSREELIGRLWGDGTVVDYDRGLNAAITRLRQALSDSAESPRYVETVARRGYRFIAPVERPEASAVESVMPPLVQAAPAKAAGRRPWALAALATLAVAVTWWIATRPGAPAPERAETLTTIPLTTEPGLESNVTFSPDGTQFAYQWQKDGDDEPHVYLRQVGMGDPTRLTKATEGEYSPAWSRDGRYIAFFRLADPQRLALIVAPVLGGGVERKLAELPPPDPKSRRLGGLNRSLDWSPDGRYLIAAAGKAGLADRPVRDALTGLMRISTETGEQNWIYPPVDSYTDGASMAPAISPDGKTLAFVRSSSVYERDIFLQPLGHDSQPSGPAVKLVSGGAAMHPAWTSDGQTIVFSLLPAFLHRVAARPGAKSVPIPEAGDGALMPRAAAVGRVAWTRAFGDTNIWSLDLGTGRAAPVITSTSIENAPEFSPDGRRIALLSWRSGTPQIWVCESDGTRCAQISALPGYTGSPRWSPDGQQLTFDSYSANGRFDIYTIIAGGGAPRRLTNNAADEAAPFWSRDGRWIYFTSTRAGRPEVWKVPAAGGAEVQVTRNGGMMAMESLDGQSLYYSRSDGETDVYRSSPDGSGEAKVLRGLLGRSFAVTRDRIYYLRPQGNGAALRAHVIATGADTLVKEIVLPVSNGLSVSPDGKIVLFSQVDSQGSDLMMADGFR